MKAADPVLGKPHPSSLRLVLGVLMSAVATIGISQPVLSQTSSDTLQPNPQSGEYSGDPFSNRGNGQMNSVFDLIHRATMGGVRDQAEFEEDQRRNINSEAADFRTRQLELLRQETEAQSPAPTDTPQSN